MRVHDGGFAIRPRLLLPVAAVTAALAALAIPVFATIRASAQPSQAEVVATRVEPAPTSPPARALVPRIGALPACPPSRFVARPVGVADGPTIGADAGPDGAGSADRMTPKGRL